MGADLFPPLIAYARIAPEHILGIEVPLDADQAVVIVAPEGMLPIGLGGAGLDARKTRTCQNTAFYKLPAVHSLMAGSSHLVHIRPGVGGELPQRLDDVGYGLELLGPQG